MARLAGGQLDEQPISSSSSPSPGRSSDKENPRRSVNKRTTMPPPSSANKRRRLTDHDANIQSQMPMSQRNAQNRYYDPDQDAGERRKIRKGLRDLTRELNDSRSEYMQTGNDGLYKTVTKANEIFVGVKQTSDATIDSRLLVNAADLSHKKTAQLALGDATAGIDVDEFVSKCISFMRRGEAPTLSPSHGTQRRRPRQSQRDPDASDDEDAGDAMNWDWLGRHACLPYSARPAVSGWLLGPLSVQKRARQMTQRRAHERIDPSQAVEPNELKQQDLGDQENVNLAFMCSTINKLLADVLRDRNEAASNDIAAMLAKTGQTEPSFEQVKEAAANHGITDDGGLNLFHVCINPRSFGQSVENLFYISFLVRDGNIGLQVDSRQIPSLHSSDPWLPSEAQKQGIKKQQAIFSLDFETWQELVDAFDIKKCIIPHRDEIEAETNQAWSG
ncbi:hypothetical protein N7474_001737 [Penicillium riverlandense]|uniref:uncharacterized protein n=1 Tax=Penicillium riverlandense TaxID=1903569 RepID=UPI0025488819|nr:uncharacterized protein N7474_001737 [Penicillium riverlandense]KAJ5833426.1 hypothetical protein N7474_001737 [Penicillium riverlandense]